MRQSSQYPQPTGQIAGIMIRVGLMVWVMFVSSVKMGVTQAQSSPLMDDNALPSLPSSSSPQHWVATGSQGVVVTAQREATQVGLRVLKSGGNAVDAAVAIGYALAVTHPCCGNLGGGGFMLIRHANGKATFLNFRETAPAAATPQMFVDAQQGVMTRKLREGYLSVGIPGTVKGLEYARRKYGSQSRKALLAPAIALANSGYELHAGDVGIFQAGLRRLTLDPKAAAQFLQPDQRPHPVGYRLKQPNLAKTLQLIARKGENAFYQGAIAKDLVQASQKAGGIFSLQDFRDYRVVESAPLTCHYRGYTILTAPLPGGGITLCQMLILLEGYPVPAINWQSAASLHKRLAVMLLAYADRNRYLGDPAFVNPPVAKLLSPDYLEALRKTIPPDRALPPEPLYGNILSSEGENTTHYSVMDAAGNAVAVTYTINAYFGSGMIAGDTGFLLNNEMDDFTAKPGVPNSFGLVQGTANLVAPGKRPLSSMSPTMVLQQDKIRLIAGTPGGSTIPTTLLNVITQVVDQRQSLKDTVQQPRLHYQGLPNRVMVEPNALPASIQAELEKMGYRFFERSTWGAAMSIEIDPKTGLRTAVMDPRKPAGLALAE